MDARFWGCGGRLREPFPGVCDNVGTMRELHGAIYAGFGFSRRSLKQHALLFDKLVVLGLNEFVSDQQRPNAEECRADVDFLCSRSRAVIEQGPGRGR